MKPDAKDEMFKRYSEDPEKWTVPKLASSFSVSQPRVQAILLMKTWEKKKRDAGLISAEDDKLEALVYQTHLDHVKNLEATHGVKLRRNRFTEESESSRAGGPLGRFRTVFDDEAAPKKPDPLAHFKRDDEQIQIKAELKQKLVEDAIRVQKKRWTFVVHDTSS